MRVLQAVRGVVGDVRHRAVARWVFALAAGAVWWWAALRVAVHPAQAGPAEGAVLAGGWALGMIPVHAMRQHTPGRSAVTLPRPRSPREPVRLSVQPGAAPRSLRPAPDEGGRRVGRQAVDRTGSPSDSPTRPCGTDGVGDRSARARPS